MPFLKTENINIPDFLIPWLTRFYEPHEINLLKLIADNPLEKEPVIRLLEQDETLKDIDPFLKRAWKRGVIQFIENDKLIAPEDFHTRYEYWALFEGFKDIPVEIKDKLNDWELNSYIASHGRVAENLKQGRPRDPDTIYPEYLLLHEVEALFKKIPRFYLWPCNCRAMVRGCGQTEFTCIRFSNNRDIGWEISGEKALNIVKEANRKGLVQSAELGLDEDGRITGALCNCCSDCCFPHQLSEHLDVQRYWPISRYVAQPPTEKCNKCGNCVKRCPFDVISQEKHPKGKERLMPVIDLKHCRGCGICATGCPQDAIELNQVSQSLFEKKFQLPEGI